MPLSERDQFLLHCEAAAAAARSAGMSFGKVPGYCAIEVRGHGSEASAFPIVSDERTWRETSAEEAFYGMLCDVYAWAVARVDDAKLARLAKDEDALAREEIRREVGEQLVHLRALAAHAGGIDALKDVWAAGGLEPAALDGLRLT